MPNTHTQWSEEDINILLHNYANLSIKELQQLLPNKTLISIRHKATKLKIKRTCSRTKTGNLSKLLEETPEAYYWIGFLLADGYLRDTGQLTININDKDLIDAFSKYINYTGTLQYITHNNINHNLTYGLTVYDKIIVNQIKTKFNISNTKTSTPPNLKSIKITKPLLTALLIGYIDGDGSIKKEGHCVCQCHSTWLSEYTYLESVIQNGKPPKISNRNQAYMCISVETMQKLKSFARCNKLPILLRKWNRVKNETV